MEKFGFSGLWKHAGTSITSGALLIADGVVTYLGVVDLPSWAHALVGIAALVLGAYKGSKAKPAELRPAA